MKFVSRLLPMLSRCLLAGLLMAVLLSGMFGGFYLLHRLVKFLRTPQAERRQQRALKEAARAHPLAAVSGRGRTAYVILCLENALAQFGQTAADWTWVLERLWALTEAPEKELAPLFRVCQLLPVNILPYGRAEDIYSDPMYETLADIWDGEPEVSEEDFLLLRTLYIQAGWRMCVLDPLLGAVYKTAAASRLPHETSEALRMDLLRQTEGLLQGWDIPLPQEKHPEAMAFLLGQTAPGWGAPFDGAAWSGFLGTEEERIARESNGVWRDKDRTNGVQRL